MIQQTLKGYFRDFSSLIYPHCCAACGNALYRNENILCLKCYAELPRTGFHRDPDNEVAQLFWGRVPLRTATAFMYFAKESRFRGIVHALKYHGRMEIGVEMGRMFGMELKDTLFAEADLIIPVPLHPRKLRKRGYNQSRLIASGMAGILHLPVKDNLISRVDDPRSQTRKTRYERWENVRETFRCENPAVIRNKHVLLVDDVITTGATIEACASCLLAAEGVTISAASLAFAKLR